MKLSGISHKFGDDISTDLIIPGRFFHLRSNLLELAKHLMEDSDPDFVNRVKPGDFIVAGRNFGCGSSREHAPTIIKMAGISTVIAKSFARIFYRNSINLGLLPIEADTDGCEEGDSLEIEIESGIIKNNRNGQETRFLPPSPPMLKILSDGGLISHIKKHGGIKL
ncbi:3-isopropylmalate dehydratase small subunit [bacterium]|nr:3-isopropylmalate dehydratase small subunit [bacterium]MBU2462364.1 3-isopropylmalate dehydratase small subunit [bacterium]